MRQKKIHENKCNKTTLKSRLLGTMANGCTAPLVENAKLTFEQAVYPEWHISKHTVSSTINAESKA